MLKKNQWRALSTREDWNASAEQYAGFVCAKNLYRDSARAMVKMAQIKPGMTVLDLACGTGIVTQTIIEHRSAACAKLIAVDYSEEMLECARRRTAPRDVEFYRGLAESLSKVIRTKVDRVLCNAAFWHFNRAKALKEIGRILNPSGLCLIGLPVQNFKLLDIGGSRGYKENKVFWMILEEKMLRGYASSKPEHPTTKESKEEIIKDKNEVVQYFPPRVFELERIENLSIQISPKDYIDFLRIPVMIKGSFLFKGVPDQDVQDILDVVERELQWVGANAPPFQWQIHVLRKSS